MSELLNEFGVPDNAKWHEVYRKIENAAWSVIIHYLDNNELTLAEIKMISLYFSTYFHLNFAEYILKEQVAKNKSIIGDADKMLKDMKEDK